MTKRFANAVGLPLRLIGALFLILTTATAVLAIEDTPENRAKQLDRYFDAIPFETMAREMMANMAKQSPGMQQQILQSGFPDMTAEQRAKAIEISKDVGKLVEATIKHIDFAVIKKIQRDVLLSALTADEISAIADFYTSPAGKAAGAKMGKLSEEMMPLMTPIMVNAVMRAQVEEKKK